MQCFQTVRSSKLKPLLGEFELAHAHHRRNGDGCMESDLDSAQCACAPYVRLRPEGADPVLSSSKLSMHRLADMCMEQELHSVHRRHDRAY